MADRVILHCDCNSFFASVETVLNPEYKNVPMAVCGSQEDRHGIVLAKNDIAKAYGIVTAETVHSARKRCPSLVIAKPHYDEYIKFSKRVNEIYSEYTDLIEPFGIDESWLDVTASERAFGSGRDIAEEIRRRVKAEVGITVSIGVSFNKVFAKLGSDYKKPDAITCITRENFKEIVHPMPACALLFVGRKTEEMLNALGVRTIGDLASAPVGLLSNKLGKAGQMLSLYARGEDSAPVESTANDDAKSVGNGFTFKHDLVTVDHIRLGIDYLTEEIGRRLRAKGLSASTVSVSVKDEFMRVVQRQRHLPRPTDIGREISDVAFDILMSEWQVGKPIRTITVTAQSLTKSTDAAEQLDMFGGESETPQREKQRKREEMVDKIRQKHGRGAIVTGATIDNDIGVFDPKTSKK